jgi:hypothetical protein
VKNGSWGSLSSDWAWIKADYALADVMITIKEGVAL